MWAFPSSSSSRWKRRTSQMFHVNRKTHKRKTSWEICRIGSSNFTSVDLWILIIVSRSVVCITKRAETVDVDHQQVFVRLFQTRLVARHRSSIVWARIISDTKRSINHCWSLCMLHKNYVALNIKPRKWQTNVAWWWQSEEEGCARELLLFMRSVKFGCNFSSWQWE